MNKSLFAAGGVIFLFGVGLIGFISMMAGSLFVATTGLSDTADGFFQNVANEEFSVARDFLSADYSNSMTDEEFENFVKSHRLDQFVNSFWNTRSINNNQGQLTGTVETASGESIPLEINLVHEMDQWKIVGLNPQNNPSPSIVKSAGKTDEQPDVFESSLPDTAMDLDMELATESSTSAEAKDLAGNDDSSLPALNVSAPILDDQTEQPGKAPEPSVLTIADIPDLKVAGNMAKRWTTEFCKGVSQQDFKSFHVQLAPQMRDRFPLVNFTKVFQEFIDRDIDLGWVRNVSPVFDQNPSLDAAGVLVLQGHFPADPKVTFEYGFKRIDEDWKPVRINLEVPNEENAPVAGIPSEDELKDVVLATTKAFGKSVKAKDFTSFHRSTYSKFQEKFSVRQFAKYFQSFVDQNADLNWIDGVQPVFDVTPSINLNGFLSMEGHFPSEPKVLFRYAFVRENGNWKVSTINLSIADDATSEEPVNADVQKRVN